VQDGPDTVVFLWGGLVQQLPTKEAFQASVNSTFKLLVEPDTWFDLKLTEMTEGRSLPRQEQFSLIFQAPLDAPPEQRIYRLEHERLGMLDLFLVPIERNGTGVCFQAVFNRSIVEGA
jgi:hypothetical protein